MTQTTPKLQIDIVSDVMCPWCIVGYKQLAAALEATGIRHEIRWHPFELNPNMPPEGQNIREYLAEKYGSTKEELDSGRVHLTQAGAEVGFEFRDSDNRRMYNSFNQHQLLHWAEPQGRMHDLEMALFAAHFTQGRDLSDNAVLADVAAEIGPKRWPCWSINGLPPKYVRTSRIGSTRVFGACPPWSSTGATW